MTSKTKPRYWYCVIGPVPANKIPSCGDGPPRMAARRAVLDITGIDPSCASGWIDEEEAEAMSKAGNEAYRKLRNESHQRNP